MTLPTERKLSLDRFIKIKMYFNLVDLFDRHILEKECNDVQLDIVFFDSMGLNGVVCVSLIAIPLEINSIEQIEKIIRKLFKEALLKSLRQSDNSKKIFDYLSKTQYSQNLVNVINLIRQRVHEGKENIAYVENYLARYEHIIGAEGIQCFIKILLCDSKKILRSYSEYQDFMLKKYQIELFISQQVNLVYLTVLMVEESKIIDSEIVHIDISGLDQYTFKKISWSHAFLKDTSRLYICIEKENFVLVPLFYKNTANDTLIGLILSSNNISSGLNFLEYALKQDHELFEDEMNEIPIRLDSIRDNLVTAKSGEIADVQKFILSNMNLLKSTIDESYSPLLNNLNHLRISNIRGNSTEKKILSYTVHGERGKEIVDVTRVKLPAILNFNLPSKKIPTLIRRVMTEKNDVLKVMDAFRKLLIELEEYKQVKLLREHELEVLKLKELEQKEKVIQNRIMFVIDIIKNLFK